MHNAFGEFQNALLQLLKVMTNFKTKQNMLLQSLLTFYLCVYFLVLGVMAPLGILSTFSPLKGQRSGYRFSKKYSSNPTSLQNLSNPWLSNVFLNKFIFGLPECK